jgi:hypothetical protein
MGYSVGANMRELDAKIVTSCFRIVFFRSRRSNIGEENAQPKVDDVLTKNESKKPTRHKRSHKNKGIPHAI